MKSRQNRWNGGYIGSDQYIDVDGMFSTSQNYTRNVGCDISGLTGSTYTRPSEWISLPSITAGTQRFAGVFAVYNNDSNFVAFTVAGNYTVDWGDGTTSAHSSATTAYKRYDTTTFAGLTSSIYNGYKTLIISIIPTGAANLTSINLAVKHNQTNLPVYVNQWLDIRLAGASLSTIKFGTDWGGDVQPYMLEQYEFVGNHSATSFQQHFANCRQLKNIIIPSNYTSNLTNLNAMFLRCQSIETIPDLDTANTTNFGGLFSTCSNLKRVPNLSSTSKGTNFSAMFASCFSLNYIPAFDTSNATTMQSMFFECFGIKTIPWFDTRKVTSFAGMFRSCRSLRKIPFLNTSGGTNFNGLFWDCWSLETIPPLDFSKNTDFSYTFAGCFSLKKLPPIVTSSATSMNFMFYGGSQLREITFIDTSNVTSFAYCFFGCSTLQTINNLNLSKATNLVEAFGLTSSLKKFPTVTFNPNLTNASYIFTTTGIEEFGNTFFDFPNATTTEGLFRWSASIRECPAINAPKSLNALNMFTDNKLLERVGGLTLASGVSMASFNSSGFNGMFSGCDALIEVPTIDFSGLTGSANISIFTNMLNNCKSLSDVSGFTGISYNFSVSGCKLSGTALNNLYTSLAVVGASGSNTRTITVSTNWGAATDDPNIAIAKGWQVTG